MKLINLNRKEVNINTAKYKINWDKQISKPQKVVKDFLYPFWKSDNCFEELRIPNSLLRIDLLNITRKIIVEVSPRQHQEFNSFLHGNRFEFLASIKRDEQKRVFAELNNYKFVELYESDIKNLSKTLFLEKFNIFL